MDGFCPFVRMAHVTIDRGEDGVGAPWAGHEAVCEGEGEPVGWEEVRGCWFPEGAWSFGLDEAVDGDDDND